MMARRRYSPSALWAVVLVVAGGGLFLDACRSSRRETYGVVGPGWKQVGIASWYGREFHGRYTASGERYDMYALTAAHKTLPFGALVRVTRLDDGRSVLVRINDRGPFVRGRVIDLSYAAAKKIGLDIDGIAKVRLEFAGWAEPDGFWVQVGAFADESNADRLVSKLVGMGFRAVAEEGDDGLWRVRVGPFGSRSEADKVKSRLKREYPGCFIMSR